MSDLQKAELAKAKEFMSVSINRDKWNSGPWDNEADQKTWMHQGIPCVIRRTPLGHLCGYVALLSEHPLFNASKNHFLSNINVHGGITFDEIVDGIRWIGFDCAHFNDLSPGLSFSQGIYRNMQYVTTEVNNMAEQIFGFLLEKG